MNTSPKSLELERKEIVAKSLKDARLGRQTFIATTYQKSTRLDLTLTTTLRTIIALNHFQTRKSVKTDRRRLSPSVTFILELKND
jgi:hypothetical protein